MKNDLEQQVAVIVKNLFGVDIVIELTRPEEQFGDYSTNVALQLAKQLGKQPREIAEALAVKLRESLGERVREVTVAGPGFINLMLPDKQLFEAMQSATQLNQSLQGRSIVFEYSDPNPFKVLHAGHLYQTMIGDAIANILEKAGAEVHRVNFGGDVGRHVGMTMWAILDTLTDGSMDEATAYDSLLEISQKSLDDRSAWLSAQYIKGTEAYETNDKSKAQITALNKRVYQVHTDNDHESNFARIYRTTRQWSYDYFDAFYARIGSGFEKYYPESVTAPIGLKTVKEQLKNGVYEESDGAVVFKGEPYGLHTRVFINSQGLPTYEAKEVGLTMAKWQDYHFDLTIIVTGNDIIEYMKVVLKSVEQFNPELVKRTEHLTHGQVKLAGGMKMSSRKGNILRAQDVLDAAAEAGQHMSVNASDEVVLGAVKYAFTKQTLGPDVIYNPEESISIHGNSGPYLQYAHARAHSILRKLDNPSPVEVVDTLEPAERSLARKLSMYPEVFEAALTEYAPHHIANYLYELAQTFNRFYEHNRVIGDPRELVRLALVRRYADTLKAGLGLLGIAAPEQM
jgi:arginyl-tRNA synthetase